MKWHVKQPKNMLLYVKNKQIKKSLQTSMMNKNEALFYVKYEIHPGLVALLKI
jgi:hypothetical protein